MNRIFISYRWNDRKSDEHIKEFVKAIEKSTGLTAFWDTRELRSGNFISELKNGVISSDVFMPVVTKSYIAFGKESKRAEDKDFCLLEYAVAVSEGKKIIPVFIDTSATIKTISYEQAAEAAKRARDAIQTDEDLSILQQYLLSQNGIMIDRMAEESIFINKNNLNSIIYETFCSSDKISFYKHYLEDMAKKLAPIHIFGEFNDSGLTIDNSYVPLSFLHHLTEAEQKEKENRRESTAPTDAGEKTLLANLVNEKLAVIVGDSGQGKSSFVRHLTILLAKQAKQNGLSRELFFPLFFECKNIDRNSMQSYEKFWNKLAGEAKLSRPALDAVMRFGKPLYIFDAMDEIPPDQMDALVDAIYKHIYVHNHKPAYFLFTSRPGQRLISSRVDMTLSNDSRTVVRRYSVKEFDESQQKLYINKLAQAKRLNSAIINEFLQAIWNKETIISDYHSISRNPFMLFAIFSTYINGQDLPENRFDAICRVIDDVIERDLKKQDYSPINKKNIKVILGAVSCLFYHQRDIGKTFHASTQTPYDLAEKIYNLDDSDRDDRKLLNKYNDFFRKSNLLDENGFRHEFLASTYAAYYLLFLMKSKVKKEKSPLEVNDISSLKNNTDYWKNVTEALLCLVDRESEDSKTYIEPLIDDLHNTDTPDYNTLCSSVSQFVNHQPRGATLLLAGMLERGCDGIMYGEQTDSGLICHKGVNPYEELFYYPAVYPYLQQYLSNLTTGNKQGEELYLCSELIREACALFSEEPEVELQNVYSGRDGSRYEEIHDRLEDAVCRNKSKGFKIFNQEKLTVDSCSKNLIMSFHVCTGFTNIGISKNISDINLIEYNMLIGIIVNRSNSVYSSLDGVLFNKDKSKLILYPPGKIGTYIIPDSVKEICFKAFDDCTGLTSITIPDSVTKIDDDAFSGCECLKNINVSINNTVYSSVEGVLFNKNKTVLIKCPNTKSGTYTIPENVTEILSCSFSGSSLNSEDGAVLTSINIPDSVMKIGDNAFSRCTYLRDINVGINNTVYSSIDGVLFNKDRTVLIKCPNSKAGVYSIPESVTEICSYSFDSCMALISITIPNSLMKIYNHPFFNCTYLENINVSINNTVYSSIDGVLFNKDKTVLIKCPNAKARLYTIPDNVMVILEFAFQNCTNLTGITVPDSMKVIESYAFANCKSLTSIAIPDSVTVIRNGAFTGCTSLTSITLPTSMKLIESYAFSNCTRLTSITIPDSVTGIYNSAFEGCSSLQRITIPASVTYILKDAFNCCPKLTIYAPKGSYAEEYAKKNNISFAIE